jgi:hypothetical protein
MYDKRQFINVLCILFCFCFICCINKKTQTAELENAEQSNDQSSKASEIIQHELNNIDMLNQTSSSIQADTRKINQHSRLELESVSVTTLEGDVWYIGKDVNEEYTKMSNTIITTSIFGVPFGPIDGCEDEQLKIGWNNRNRVLYVEVLSNKVKTYDGISLGDTKEKVIELLGDPYIEEYNQFRYQNIDFEMIGILFQFEEGVVTKIFLFGYV